MTLRDKYLKLTGILEDYNLVGSLTQLDRKTVRKIYNFLLEDNDMEYIPEMDTFYWKESEEYHDRKNRMEVVDRMDRRIH